MEQIFSLLLKEKAALKTLRWSLSGEWCCKTAGFAYSQSPNQEPGRTKELSASPRERVSPLKPRWFLTGAFAFLCILPLKAGEEQEMVSQLQEPWRRRRSVRCLLLCAALMWGLWFLPLLHVWVKDMVGVLSGPLWRYFPLRIAVGFAHFLLVRGWDLPQAPEGGWVCAHPSHTAQRQPCPLPPACSHRLPPAPAPNPGPSLPHRPHQAHSNPKPAMRSDPQSPNWGPAFSQGLVWRRRRDPCSFPNFNHS